MDVDGWIALADRQFAAASRAANPRLVFSPPFVAVLAYWVSRSRDAGVRPRRVLRAQLCLPRDRGRFASSATAVAEEVGKTLESLNHAAATLEGLAFYRTAGSAILRLQDESACDEEAVALDLLFCDHLPGRSFGVLAVGLAIPAPHGGYRLELEDGTAAHLPAPPWRMAATFGVDRA